MTQMTEMTQMEQMTQDRPSVPESQGWLQGWKEKEKNRIDKTQALETGAANFPCLYLEGAAAGGKSTAIRMLCDRHPEASVVYVSVKRAEKDLPGFPGKIRAVGEQMQQASRPVWLIVENLPGDEQVKSRGEAVRLLWEEILEALSDLVEMLFQEEMDSRVILAGREKPPLSLLMLYWKGQMEIIPQGVLLFSREEVEELIRKRGLDADPEIIWRRSGGFAGCVDVLLRLWQRKDHLAPSQVEGVYEIDQFIEQVLLPSLSSEEREVMELARRLPWVNGELCRRGQAHQSPEEIREILQNLERKGFLQRGLESGVRVWKAAALFQTGGETGVDTLSAGGSEEGSDGHFAGPPEAASDAPSSLYFLRDMGSWYQTHGYGKEALWCYEQGKDREAWERCIVEYYDRIPFFAIPDRIMKQRDAVSDGVDLRLLYLQGMYSYGKKDLDGMGRILEQVRLRKEDTGESDANQPESVPNPAEIGLNLAFACPQLSLEDWMEALEGLVEERKRKKAPFSSDVLSSDILSSFRLYDITGAGCSCLCGLRDLSGLFACSRKQERHLAQVWREAFGEREWKAYQLARVEYTLEMGRINDLCEEDLLFLRTEDNTRADQQLSLAKFYVLCRMQGVEPDPDRQLQMEALQVVLEGQGESCRNRIRAILAMEIFWKEQPEKAFDWLRSQVRWQRNRRFEIREENYMESYYQARGFLRLNQSERAMRVLDKLVIWLKTYQRHRLLAEVLFEQAILHLKNNRSSQAIRCMIESFLIGTRYRYVRFYAGYGRAGLQALELYVDWMSSNSPELWHHKKKYNYGNVLRMPVADYLDAILRQNRKRIRLDEPGKKTAKSLDRDRRPDRASSGKYLGKDLQPEDIRETLTLMEISILQNIGQGMSNEQICKERNLQLPTVKSHIYHLYKKLGVKNRVQAILKGKELGLLG